MMMKKTLIFALALFLCGLMTAGDALARGPGGGRWHGGHGHGRVGMSVMIGAPFWSPWYYPPIYYPSIVVERQAPPVYIEQSPPAESRQSGYWYFCQSAGGYYPEVRACPEDWVKVPPRP
jgi:hypothetical protein